MSGMPVPQTDAPNLRKPLRLWPGVVAVLLLWLSRFGVKLLIPGFEGFGRGMMGALAITVAILLWWAFFSRAHWAERVGAIVLMIAGLGATWGLKHESIGPLSILGYAIPVLMLAFVVWAVATRRLSDRIRRATMAATILIACGAWALVRTDGINGDHVATFTWRWKKAPEERLLAEAPRPPSPQLTAPAAAPSGAPPQALPPVPSAAKTDANWPGFRGSKRDGNIPGVRIETNWSASSPVELWRRPIGPGWSSFAVHGDLLYTQEQRGEEELVTCYHTATGQPVWTHRDAARFVESNAGAGPRGTPTINGGRVYTFGATGILNALDAQNGTVVWSRNAASDTKTKLPYWGFASSPLVIDGLVVVAVAGQLAAYDLATGNTRWFGPVDGAGYSSPGLLTVGGVPQILLLSGAGATSVAPADGSLLWKHLWPGTPIVQPALTADGDILISADAESGTRRIAVARGSGGWTVEERWTSKGLKPYFNDLVVHNGHAYGFDARILSCIDLKDGKRKWKGGRYGNGQLILLPDQDVLLVLSEEGELALVRATSDQFTELARFPAIEGKTWNHPVLVGDVLLVRNGQEMAAFRLALARR